MATDAVPISGTQTVDLSGLPEGVVQGIRQLVHALREGQAAQGATNSIGKLLPDEQSSLIISRPTPSPDEVERLLDELAAGSPGKALPPDFSRADLYDDHD